MVPITCSLVDLRGRSGYDTGSRECVLGVDRYHKEGERENERTTERPKSVVIIVVRNSGRTKPGRGCVLGVYSPTNGASLLMRATSP